MKYNKILMLLLLVMSTEALPQVKIFNYKRKISNIDREGWYAITLPPDIFIHCNTRFNDLRLYTIEGSDTTEIPYLLKKRTSQRKQKEVTLNAINTSRRAATLYTTFRMNEDQKVNVINLDFHEENYFAFVTLEGSNDNKTWFEIAANQRIFSLVDATDRLQHTRVNFPDATYRYLRVQVKADKTLTLKNVSFIDQEIIEGEFENISLTQKIQEDKKNRQTIVDITFNHFRPVNSVALKIASDIDYYRHCTLSILYDSAKTEKGWVRYFNPLSETYLTSYTDNIFNIGDQSTKVVRITIDNRDNNPLKIETIEATGPVVEIVAFLKPADTYLFYGNNLMTAPAYDLAYFEKKIPTTLAKATTGEEQVLMILPAKTGGLLSNRFWLWGTLLTAMAVLGFFTLKIMKEAPRHKNDATQ